MLSAHYLHTEEGRSESPDGLPGRAARPEREMLRGDHWHQAPNQNRTRCATTCSHRDGDVELEGWFIGNDVRGHARTRRATAPLPFARPRSDRRSPARCRAAGKLPLGDTATSSARSTRQEQRGRRLERGLAGWQGRVAEPVLCSDRATATWRGETACWARGGAPAVSRPLSSPAVRGPRRAADV
jgi:hypothetical protein